MQGHGVQHLLLPCSWPMAEGYLESGRLYPECDLCLYSTCLPANSSLSLAFNPFLAISLSSFLCPPSLPALHHLSLLVCLSTIPSFAPALSSSLSLSVRPFPPFTSSFLFIRILIFPRVSISLSLFLRWQSRLVVRETIPLLWGYRFNLQGRQSAHQQLGVLSNDLE